MTAEEYVKHYASGQGGFESVSVDVALRAIEYAKQEAKQQLMKECIYSKDNFTDEDRKVLCDGCEEECKFNKKDEIKSVHAQHTTISSSLNAYLCKAYNALYEGNGGRLSFARLQNMAIDITEWQKQQIMAKAVDGTVRPDDGEIWFDFKFLNFEDGDKVKVIIIKED